MQSHAEGIYERIHQKLQAINSKCRPLTNCFSMAMINEAKDAWVADDALVFYYLDHGVRRLIYFAENEDALVDSLRKLRLSDENTYYLEFMARNESCYKDLLEKVGLSLHARLMRITNPDCRGLEKVQRFADGQQGRVANISDVHEMNELLWTTFHTEVSHLLTDEELSVEIEKGHTRIHRGEDGRIDALLQAEVMPKKFYINQIVNRGDSGIIHSMLQAELAGYVSRGGKYLYAWVEDSNVASLKFHAKYGMKHDGMWNMVYRLAR